MSATSSWPPVATEPGTRHPDAPAPGETLPEHYRDCFGCGTNVPGGLRLRVVAGPELTLRAEFKVTDAHQGAPGLAHGGVLTTAFDEAFGMLNQLVRVPSVTGKLETDFLRPVPVDEVLHIDARVDGIAGRKIFVSGVGRLGSPDGDAAVRARALFVQVGWEHFSKHARDLGADVNP